ncbi:MAG: F0F1 ATP synthase subunit A [Bacteroidaceae bacterium]|nr:F0F1 ATP synthase subunit A [Bacteroidaceae bacterium]
MRKREFYISCTFVLIFLNVFSIKAEENHSEKAFNVKDVIFEHLTDSYSWELPFSHTHRLYLPVIVKDLNGKWHIFSSKHLDGGNTHKGFYIAQDGDNVHKIESVDEQGNKYRPLDFSITKNVLAILFAAIIILSVLLWDAHWYKKHPYKAPRRGVAMVEIVIDMLYYEIIKPILGEDARKFAPYILTLFFFILVANLLGQIVIFPGGVNLTGNISITLVLAFMTFIVINLFGTKEYWKEVFWPDVPLWLKFPIPIMPVIEVFGVITKPFALMIRLFANMLGGHIIALSLVSLIFLLGALGETVMGITTGVSVIFSLFMKLIDVMICFIQAFVFMMLTTVFISLARVKEHEHESKKEEQQSTEITE